MRYLFFIVMTCLPLLPALAQEISEGQWLDEVEVVGIPPEKYASGSKIEVIDSVSLTSLATANLGELLRQHSGLYFKEYGNGMLSTVSFRGTGASHTAVLWNGINLNTLTLGSTDFSNLPVFMFDEVDVHYGGSSALYGSEAMGGSIVLQSQPEWIEGYRLQLTQDIGSFGQHFSGIKSTYGSGKWEGKTTAYYYQSNNDFPFKNTARYGRPEERQENAAISNLGLMQEAGYHFRTNRYICLHTWYEHSDNGILPTMGDNLKPQTYEHILDRHVRMALEYHQQESWGHVSLMSGFVQDFEVYNRQSPIATSRLITQTTYEKTISPKFELKAGGGFQHIRPEVAAYTESTRQERYDLFTSIRYVPFDIWQLTLNVRKEYITGFQAPLAPALGSELTLLQQKNQRLVLKTQASRNYRVPTFNDLYWQPGGNPDLKPENGWSVESGWEYSRNFSNFSFATEATYYRMHIKDWILWMDQGTYWSPHNLREVLTQGVEISSQFKWTPHFSLDVHYAFTAAKNKKALSTHDRSVDKQLPYTPLHTAVVNGRYQWQDWFVNGNATFTGKRFLTTTNERALEGYILVNTYLGRQVDLWKIRTSLALRINNIFNTRYQNVEHRAMPGINYQLSLQIHFSQTP